jgi:hypothetical protein
MLPKGQAERAHPQAADWVLGTLGPDEVAGFQLHLKGCPHCQAATAEFGPLGQLLQHLPPAAEPPPALEARIIASLLEAATEDRASDGRAAAAQDRIATKIHDVPRRPLAAAGTPSSPPPTQIPPAAPQAGPPPTGLPRTGSGERPSGMAKVIRFPRWPGRTGLLAIASAVAAAVIAAVLVLSGLGGGVARGAFAFKLLPAAGSAQTTASGTAAARHDASGSWNVTVTVHHLESLHGKSWYECWYVSQDGRQALSAGTFRVPPSGNGTFTMTSAADPREFQAMEITVQSPSSNGALQPAIVLIGKAQKV